MYMTKHFRDMGAKVTVEHSLQNRLWYLKTASPSIPKEFDFFCFDKDEKDGVYQPSSTAETKPMVNYHV